jgi:hypothetical protein
MNTTIKAALRADWAPAIESTARAIGVAIACVIVAADWLRFTWQHPWAGLRALEFPGAASSPNLTSSSPSLAVSLAVSPPRSAAISPRSERQLPSIRALTPLDPATRSPRSERVAPLLLLPAPAFLLLAPAPEPIAPATTPRKRGRRATRQPKVA